MTVNLDRVVGAFSVGGPVVAVERFKSGHINETYRSIVRTPSGERPFIHQRINHAVFKDVPTLMRNIAGITDHLRRKLEGGAGEPGEVALTIVPTTTGDIFLREASGDYWRTYEFIPGVVSVDVCTGTAQAHEAGRMVGKFQRYLADFPVQALVDPIPRFQDTAFRFAQLEEAIAEDRAGRVRAVSAELDFAHAQKHLTQTLATGIAVGDLPLRVTHGDTKLNNILFDERSTKGVCLVDLDTCMAGSLLYDFGDLVRSTAVRAAEDERDLTKVHLDEPIFEALTAGFLEIARPTLTPGEQALLALSPQCIVLTIGIRFLTDHLNGDMYFKIHRPGHNLDRARTQFALVQSLQRRAAAMAGLVERLLGR
jgi:Ser/Thr protein kinase RdoA (MazF antagonist)